MSITGRKPDLVPRPAPMLWGVSVAVNVLALALPLFILLIYDRILPNSATDTLLVLTMALVVVALVDFALRLGRADILNHAATVFEHRANCAALNHLLAADPEEYEKTSPGRHLERLHSVQALRAYYGSDARLQALDLPFALLFFGLIWAVAGALVLVPISIMVGMLLVGGVVGRQLRRALGARGDTDNKRQSFLIELLSGMQSVKGRQMEALMLRRYERLQESSAAATYDIAFASQSAQALGSTVANLTFLAVGLIGAASVIEGNLTIGELAAATLLSGRAVQPVLSALSLWTRFQSLGLAETRLRALFETKLEAKPEEDAAKVQLQHRVRLVGVAYEQNNGLAGLKDVNLEVRVGEIVGISGNTASGKGLLMGLLAGEIRPTSGKIFFDDVDIAGVARSALREQVAHVWPRPALFKGTIIENLSLFRGPGHVGRAMAAAAAVGLDGVVNRLPLGYETVVAAGSDDELPLGIRQMLATARALGTGRPLVLLNQVDNSVDQASGEILRKALNGLRASAAIVIVSHRPSTLAIADRVFHLENGRLEPQEPRPAAAIAGAA